MFVNDRTTINGWTSDGEYVGTSDRRSSSGGSGGSSHSFGGGSSSGGGASR